MKQMIRQILRKLVIQFESHLQNNFFKYLLITIKIVVEYIHIYSKNIIFTLFNVNTRLNMTYNISNNININDQQ